MSDSPLSALFWTAAAFLGGWLGTRLVRGYVLKKNVLDIPNERSSHSVPTPRGGGLSVVAVVTLLVGASVLAAGLEPIWLAFLVPCLAVSATGWWDDARGLSAGFRLLVQLLASGAALVILTTNGLLMAESGLELGAFGIREPYIALPFLLLFIVWMTNLYNFMDGIDGILGVQGCSVALASAALAFVASGYDTGLIYFLLAGALAGFLVLNWSPAKIFMGDVGSAFLGFAFALIALVGSARGDVSFPAILVLHAMFVGDATVTLLRRLTRGQKPHQAHRSHFYQKMVRAGWPHAKVSILFGAVNLLVLAPLAWSIDAQRLPGWAGLLLAYSVPLAFGLKYRAGAEP